jgi:light-regulated signal transduction histidine kinase (bacteriophytochrome)
MRALRALGSAMINESGAPVVLRAGTGNVPGRYLAAARPSAETVLRAVSLFLLATTTAALVFYVVYASLAAGSDTAASAATLARSMLHAWIAVMALIAALTAIAAHEAMRRDAAESEAAQLRRRMADERVSLETLREELDSFSYAVSHDVRAPLRGIDGFSMALLEDHGNALDDDAKTALLRVRNAAQRMGELIDDLVMLSWVVRAELKRERGVDVRGTARKVADDLRRSDPERKVQFRIAAGIAADADRRLLRLALENLLGNAWKFTAGRGPAIIEFGQIRRDGMDAYFVRDNGVGFDMAFASQLFGAFRRLHTAEEFSGRGIGLATVQRIVSKHGGRIWVEAESGKGAAFYFTLGKDAIA